jgi:signal peptidase I
MKKALKIVLEILLIPYLIVVIFLTTCLLNYNNYKITEFGDKSLIIVKDKSLEPTFKKGDLVVVTKNPNTDIKIGDQIFFYETYEAKISVNLGKVQNKTPVNKEETTFTMAGDYDLSSQYVIGKADTSKVYSKVGNTLGFLESKWGFLFIVVLPILIAFIYEIYVIIKEVHTEVKKNKKSHA